MKEYEGGNDVLIPLVRILKNQEYCEWILKKDVKDSYLVLHKNGLCWCHEGLIEKFPSIVVELSLNAVIEVDIASHTVIRVNGEEVKGIEHAKVLDLSDDGERWEGDVLNNKPYGWGVLYNSEGEKVFEGFRIGGVNVCYGTRYYSDIQKMDYEGVDSLHSAAHTSQSSRLHHSSTLSRALLLLFDHTIRLVPNAFLHGSFPHIPSLQHQNSSFCHSTHSHL